MTARQVKFQSLPNMLNTELFEWFLTATCDKIVYPEMADMSKAISDHRFK